MSYQNNQNNRYDSNNILKNNSRKILYVAVAVAALFVAAISGTFAYFQASATNNSISGGIATISMYLNVRELANDSTAINANLIPMDTDDDMSSYQGINMLNKALSKGCVDDNKNTVCKVYQIDVKVPANSPRIPITGTVTFSASSIPQLTYTIIKRQTSDNISASDLSNNAKPNLSTLTSLSFTDSNYYTSRNYLSRSTAVEPNSTLNKGANVLVFSHIENTYNGFLAATTSSPAVYTYYLIIWLEDSNTNQTTTNTGNYTGTVEITSGDGGKVTATFS